MNNVLFTKVIISRNVKDYKFSPKLTQENKEEIVSKLNAVLNKKMSLIQLNSIDADTIARLKASRLLNSNATTMFLDGKNDLVINMFSGEHLNIVATGKGYDTKALDKAKELSDFLSTKINLSYTDEYGYLMSDISKIGAGIELSCDVCLDSIREINKIDQVKQNMRKLGYVLKSTKNKSIFTISTTCNLGFSEKEIFDEFGKIVAKLNELEIESAKMLDVSRHDELLDKARRSMAILDSAYLMSYEELSDILLNIRTGINLDLVNIDPKILMKLQTLVWDKNEDFVSQSELKQLAEKVRKILTLFNIK